MFESIGGVYDLISDPQKRAEREGGVLRAGIAPGARVLDVACGNGVHASLLAAHGAEVTARDLSPSLIAYARRTRSHAHLTYAVGDMCDPPAASFDHLLCLGNSLNLLSDMEVVQGALVAWRGCLPGGGTLWLHGLNPRAPVHREAVTTVRRGAVEGVPVTVQKSLIPHGGRRLLALAWVAGEGENCESFVSHSVLLDVMPEDLDTALASAGFGVRDWFAGFSGEAFDTAQSPDWLVKAG